MKDCKDKTCLRIDMSAKIDRNIALKESEKLSNYKDIEVEIDTMRQLKTKTIPGFCWSTRTAKKDGII